MAPSKFDPRSTYSPLDVSLNTPGIPSWVFNEPFKTFNDSEKETNALQAQEIINKYNQTNAALAQQRLDEQAAQIARDNADRQAILDKYAQVQDLPFSDQVDAMGPVQLGQGRLKEALAIEEQAARDRNQVLSPADRQLLKDRFGLDIEEGGTKSTLSDLAGLARNGVINPGGGGNNVGSPGIGAVDPSEDVPLTDKDVISIVAQSAPPKSVAAFSRMAAQEIGVVQGLDKARAALTDIYDKIADTPTAETLDRLDSGYTTYTSGNSQILSTLQANWKGVPSDKDMEVIKQLTPSRWDQKEQIIQKRDMLISYIEANSKPTPVLDAYVPTYRKRTSVEGMLEEQGGSSLGNANPGFPQPNIDERGNLIIDEYAPPPPSQGMGGGGFSAEQRAKIDAFKQQLRQQRGG